MTTSTVQHTTFLAATLARFEGGLTWPQIYALDGRTKGGNGSIAEGWRALVGDAEDAGLLRWEPRMKGVLGRWHLTDAGREYVRERGAGAA